MLPGTTLLMAPAIADMENMPPPFLAFSAVKPTCQQASNSKHKSGPNRERSSQQQTARRQNARIANRGASSNERQHNGVESQDAYSWSRPWAPPWSPWSPWSRAAPGSRSGSTLHTAASKEHEDGMGSGRHDGKRERTGSREERGWQTEESEDCSCGTGKGQLRCR